MPWYRTLLSFKSRIIGITVLILLISMGSLLMVGVSEFMDDKGSYFMDYNLNQVRLAANSVDHQIQRALWMARLIDLHARDSENLELAKIYDEAATSIRLKKLLILTVGKEGLLKTLVAFGDGDGTLVHSLDQLGWDSARFLHDGVLIGKASTGTLAVGTLIRSPDGGGTASVFFMTPDVKFPDISDEYQVLLVDAMGDSVFTSNTGAPSVNRDQVMELLKPVLEDKETSGVRKWTMEHENYLAAYQRLEIKDLSVLCLVREKLAFGAVRGLVFRSISLGLGLVLIMIGILLLCLKRMTQGLLAMVDITEQVRKGVFSFRVDTRGLGNDEVGALAASFNLMAAKIDHLMAETAMRVADRYDRETSQAVQGNFFPSRPLNLTKLSVCGKSFYSKECGGDWWHYEDVNDYLILIVAQVGSRGLPAAITLSAMRGAYTAYRGSLRAMAMETPRLKQLAESLNTAAFEANGGKQKVNCFMAVIDTHTGQMDMMNFSHPIPYLQRMEFEQKPENPVERFEVLPLKKRPPLGTTPLIKVESETFQLNPGDMIFLYSNGLLTTVNPKGERFSSDKIFGFLADYYDQNEGQASKVASGMFEKFTEFFAETSSNPPEDVSAVFVNISKKTKFTKKESEAA